MPRGSGKKSRDPDLDWDDDELETSIYDGPEGEKPNPAPGAGVRAALPAAATEQSSAQMTLPGHAPPRSPQPELLNLVPATEGTWNDDEDGPMSLADGSAEKRSPFTGREPNEPSALAKFTNMPGQAPIYDSAYAVAYARAAGARSKTSVIAALAAVVLLLAGGGLAIFFIAKRGDDATETTARTEATPTETAKTEPSSPSTQASAANAAAPAVAQPAIEAKPVDPATGFDLIVDPAGTSVKLNGKPIGKAPLQIRNLAEGDHVVELEAPPGFFNKTETVRVVRGQAERVEIALDATQVAAKFESQPSGATVTLISGDKRVVIGKTPIQAQLDPRQRYEAMFSLDNHVSVTRPVEIGLGRDVKLEVPLEATAAAPAVVAQDPSVSRAAPAASEPVAAEPAVAAPLVAAAAVPKAPRRDRDRDRKEARKQKEPRQDSRETKAATPREIVAEARPTGAPSKSNDGDEPPSAEPEEGNPADYGTLRLGSKPPCAIYIDGRNTGKKTPQRAIRLKGGVHKITLVNNEYGIKETFTVKIRAGETTTAIKDMADQIQ
jgi:hypothetical protein